MKVIELRKGIKVKIEKSPKHKKSMATLPDGKKLHFKKKSISKKKFWLTIFKQ